MTGRLGGQRENGFLAVVGRRLEYSWVPPHREDLPTLVLLHEGLGCVAMWRDFPERLADQTGAGVFTYSRAGYGASQAAELPRPERYMHDEALEVLPKLLALAGIRRSVLVGHSDGASIALIYAGGSGRDDVEGLVAIAPHVFNEQLSIESIQNARTLYETTDLRAKLARYHGTQVDAAFRGWNDVWLRKEFRHWNIEEYLDAIRVPVLLVQGEQDQFGTLLQLQSIERRVGGSCRTLLLPECGHSPHRDQPQSTQRAVAAFVAEVAA
ncbi:MAG: alpha/beta hydrolase [Gammaproteobacteria bacterium]|nr:alpha/beta hydrolase [Gammaproteobacteria bacterium]